MPMLHVRFSKLLLVLVLLLVLWGNLTSAAANAATRSTNISQDVDVSNAVNTLKSLGVPLQNLCTTHEEIALDYSSFLPLCKRHKEPSLSSTLSLGFRRNLQEEIAVAVPAADGLIQSEEGEEEEPSFEEDPMFYVWHGICAAICVTVAALAAGLTMGLLSLDPLMLLIKMRAGATPQERAQAEQLLPIVKQHHLLLVTLLLLNSMANEALPLFLEVLVSPVVAVILSVTLVLFFGEIIPSAVFTGPNKIELASKMTPVVRLVMFLLWPIAFPIAKMLDNVLHEDEDTDHESLNRGELSALVRIQYEERMAGKKERKKQREAYRKLAEEGRSSMLDAAVRASKLEIEEVTKKKSLLLAQESDPSAIVPPLSTRTTNSSTPVSETGRSQIRRDSTPSIHLDEVSMVEGALQMKTKVAMDVYTPIHRMFSIPYDTVLDEPTVVSIYSSGYSRVPVFQPNPEKPKQRSTIIGILQTKQLIVVSPNECRPVDTLPLYKPLCVSPKVRDSYIVLFACHDCRDGLRHLGNSISMVLLLTCLILEPIYTDFFFFFQTNNVDIELLQLNLADLLNHFQTGRVGHLALVCARPKLANETLNEGRPLSQQAGFMG